jgi:hypothetical protein
VACAACPRINAITTPAGTNGFTTETWKKTGSDGRRKNIGTGEVTKTMAGTMSGTGADTVIKAAKTDDHDREGWGMKRTIDTNSAKKETSSGPIGVSFFDNRKEEYPLPARREQTLPLDWIHWRWS